MADNSFQGIVSSMMKGMEGFLSSKTVVGEPTQIGDTTIIPLVDVTFGVGAGAFVQDTKSSSGGGMGGKMTPSSVLVIKDGCTKLVNVRNQDAVTKVLDMVPDMVNKFIKNDAPMENPEVAKTVENIVNPEDIEE